jgi:hypothetical protein
MTAKDFLGGIFKWPDLRDIKNKIRGKFGYLPRDGTIENPNGYSPRPLVVPPFMPPVIYHMRARLTG